MKNNFTNLKRPDFGKFMRRTFLLVLPLVALTAYGQTMDQRITVTAENEPLEAILNQIETNTGYLFLFSNEDIDTSVRLSLNQNNSTVKEVLDALASGSNLSYTVINRHIVLSKAAPQQSSPAGGPIRITGRVVDENGIPAIGASVIIQGTTTGTSTDAGGNFTIQARADDVLLITYLGYESQTTTVGNRTNILVTLREDAVSLEGVVVTALGIKKEEKSLSYNVQQIGTDALAGVADPNLLNSLSGKIVGATINSSSAGTGGATRIVMRGTKSISGNNNALYVVDGIPMPNLRHDSPSDLYEGAGQSGDGIASINQEDIESISVLSGPSAAALYGSAAANGVVLITTKKGTADRLVINVSNNTTFSNPLILPKLQTTYGQMEPGSFDGWGEKLTERSSYRARDFFQTGVNTTSAISLSAGTDRNQTFVSVGNVNADGIINNNEYKRYNFTVRNTTKFLDNKMTLDVSYMLSDIMEKNMTAQGQYYNPLLSVYLFPPGDDFEKIQVFERYNAARNFKTQFWPFEDAGLNLQNPYWITQRNIFKGNKSRHMGSVQLQYQVLDWLNLSGRAKLDKSNEKYQRKNYASTIDLFASSTGYYSLAHEDTRQMYADFLVNIDRYFADDMFNVTANVGTSIEDVKWDRDFIGGNLDWVPNLFTLANIANLNENVPEYSQEGYHTQKQSIFASAQFGYKGMVYLDVTARNDWASQLAGSNTKSFFYPSVGLSGVITDIFNIRSSTLSFLKLRVSYSEVGNEPDKFLTIQTYPLGTDGPNTTTLLQNLNLEPERTKSWEAGFNLSMLENSLSADVTFYTSSTYNQYFNPALSSTSGYTSVWVNAGKVDNKGIEASLRYDKKWGDFRWNSYLNYSINRNKIKELLRGWTNPETGEIVSLLELDMGGTSMYKMRLVEGGSMGDIYVNTLKTDEHGAIYVDPITQQIQVESNNWIYAGNSDPKYNLAWGNNLAYKGVNLGFQFSARVGGVVVSNTQAVLDAFGVSKDTATARDEGGALVNGKRVEAKYYYQTVGGGASGGVGAMYVYKATNVRLAELTLGYSFPQISKWTGDAIKNLNVSFVGRNLFFLYNKAPFDPELTASTSTYFQGIDYFMMPSTRNLGFSVRLTF
ncbi:MAG: SusC/RagA family TonB-linked outer membrane protein [Rikenellaceae bacterium]|nr:SusC/RagA family TonB-linked outer membrane protein [Rikenellaceae bacterium]